MAIAIAGTGSIGCFVGGLLAMGGHEVRGLARPRILSAATDGVQLTDYTGLDATVTQMILSADPAAVLQGAETILVCVKSADTAEIAQQIGQHAPQATVISLQNGVTNVPALRAALPDQPVIAGMVPFNVVPTGPARFHRGTSGDILLGPGAPDLTVPHLTFRTVDNIEAVQWGKLLINLGNGLNALSDLPLRDMLQTRAWRKLMADQMSEALHVLRAHGITPAKTTAVPPALLPHILRLPTPLFRRIASKMLTIDPKARSSMWDDLNQRRRTEVDALQGVVIELARQKSLSTPIADAVLGHIKAAEAAQAGSPGLQPKDVTRNKKH